MPRIFKDLDKDQRWQWWVDFGERFPGISKHRVIMGYFSKTECMQAVYWYWRNQLFK